MRWVLLLRVFNKLILLLDLLPAQESQTLEKLEGITQMSVLHAGEPLKPLPKRFEMRLTSTRERFRTGYSSAFTIQYRLRADAEKGEMVLEPWRKNDHDTLIYNTKEKTLKLLKSHWMAGTTESTEADQSQSISKLSVHSVKSSEAQSKRHFLSKCFESLIPDQNDGF